MVGVLALTAAFGLASGVGHGYRLDDRTVVIPVVMHGEGAEETEWLTDVWITNWSTIAKDITVAYYPDGAAPMSFVASIGSFETLKIEDIVLSRFGSDQSRGLLVLSTDAQSNFQAQARIYNVGNPAGEFGQFVPGIGLVGLKRQGLLSGLSGVDGNRTNLGIANPNQHDIEASITMYDGGGTALRSQSRTVPALSTLQINNVFGSLGVAPQDNVHIEVATPSNQDIFYAYASVVRTGTGDAILIVGTSPNV
jgi:hypothetical protein